MLKFEIIPSNIDKSGKYGPKIREKLTRLDNRMIRVIKAGKACWWHSRETGMT
jgi:hypothetical protein